MFLRAAISEHRTGLAVGTRLGQSPFFQAKMSVNQPGDIYEREADAVADAIMRKDAGVLPDIRKVSGATAGGVQRICADCAEKKEEDTAVQRKESGAGSSARHQAPAQVQNLLPFGGGHPLDNNTRHFMETRFGRDFSAVRIHTDSRAAASAAALQARAYTSGHQVVFGAGEYQPDCDSGRQLIAHELTHVVQQNGNPNGQPLMRKASFTLHPAKNNLNPAAHLDIQGGVLGTKLGSTTISMNTNDQLNLPRITFDKATGTCSVAEPVNSFQCNIALPVKDVWRAQVDRSWAISRIKGAQAFFEKNGCSGSKINIIIQTGDRDKKIEETAKHEAQHAKDMEAVFNKYVKPWDTEMAKRVNSYQGNSFDAQKCSDITAEERKTATDMIRKVESDIAKKAQDFHSAAAGNHHVPLTPKKQDCENMIFKL